eukprot:TRINITY_DN27436_c0_g1_i1.p1 TRINITY_DN27436_c0_g1~~TRINITY_DN27436_c0_g1_i1.p1  ORF type:complete len:105 (-),score=22.48 TRINITY_DN27436_c0_g1_i1:99-413(-)
MFTAPSSRKYLVTLTAMLNTLPSKNAYLCSALLRKNGKVTSLDDYLLVEHGKVADLRTEVQLYAGDTLSVYVGRQVDRKYQYGSSGTLDLYDGFFLEDIKFCIF